MQAENSQGDVIWDCGPVFVGGGERSGKTLIRFMLSELPNLAMTRRVNMWPNFYLRYGDLAEEGNFERCLDAMVHYKHVRFLQPDPDRIRREFHQGPPTYAHLFALFQEHHAEREGKPRWGDQTGYIERYVDPIFEAYPSAKMIHMIRDPRDCFESSFAKAPHRKGRAGISTASWLYSANLAKRNLEKYPARYKVVQYERMVSRPEETMREVCNFIGAQYSPAMLTMGHVPRFQPQNEFEDEPGQNPLSTEYIGRYLEMTPTSGIAFIQMFARGEMGNWNYTPAPVRFSLLESLRYILAVWPVNFVSMMAWRASEGKNFNHPRKPGDKATAKVASRHPGSNPDPVT